MTRKKYTIRGFIRKKGLPKTTAGLFYVFPAGGFRRLEVIEQTEAQVPAREPEAYSVVAEDVVACGRVVAVAITEEAHVGHEVEPLGYGHLQTGLEADFPTIGRVVIVLYLDGAEAEAAIDEERDDAEFRKAIAQVGGNGYAVGLESVVVQMGIFELQTECPFVTEFVTDFRCEAEIGFVGVVVSPKAYFAAAIELCTCRQGDNGCNQGKE